MAITNKNTLTVPDSRRRILAKINDLERVHAQTYEELVSLRLQCEDRWAFRPLQVRTLGGVLTDMAVSMQAVRIVVLRGRRSLS